MDEFSEFYVRAVEYDENRRSPVIVLVRRNGAGVFGVLVSTANAKKTVTALDPKERAGCGARPLEWEFTTAALKAAGATVNSVLVDRVTNEGVFCATVELGIRGGSPQRIDARPSDAIPLALACGAPILVAESVIKNVKTYTNGKLPFRALRPDDVSN